MSRIPLAEPEALPPFLKSMHDNARPDDWSTRRCAQAFAAHPELLETYLKFYYPFHSSVGVIEPRLKELIRLRIATLNGCKTCKAARLAREVVSEREAIAGVDQSDDEASFSPREKAAIRLAETMALDQRAACAFLRGRAARAHDDGRPVHRLRPHARDPPARGHGLPDLSTIIEFCRGCLLGHAGAVALRPTQPTSSPGRAKRAPGDPEPPLWMPRLRGA
jgi:AhpD family alkylhydroperoxidase